MKKVIISGIAILENDVSNANTELEINEEIFKKHINKKDFKICTRATKIALTTADMAIIDAGLIANIYYPPERRSVYISSPNTTTKLDEMFSAFEYVSANDNDVQEKFMQKKFSQQNLSEYWQKGAKRIFPLWIVRGLSNVAIGLISIRYNFKGESCNWSDWGNDGRWALEEGVNSILEGRADLSLVGAYDSYENWYHQLELNHCRELSNYKMFEGGAFLVLEEYSKWKERIKDKIDVNFENRRAISGLADIKFNDCEEYKSVPGAAKFLLSYVKSIMR
ncbi:MAG: hypothetical protein HQK49_15770 [Oligoflexia bacterium]|nr:hypothetical protein [Oligoflexia bacterium]